MSGYVIRRLLLLIVTLFLVSVIVFLLVRLIPGDIVDAMIGDLLRSGFGAAAHLDREAIERALGLDVPVHVQYGRWIGDILRNGNLGVSLRYGRPVTGQILSRIGVTLELGLLGTLIGVLIALPVGVYSAVRQDHIGDYLARTVAIVFIALPPFFVATLVLLFPAIWWGWAPRLQYVSFAKAPLENLGILLIPSLILGMTLSGNAMRITRSMMLEVLRQDYIRTAYSKGLMERLVIARHALKNALVPVVTTMGRELPVLVGGAVIIEQIFALPGMGRLLVESLQTRDYTMVSGINLVFAFAVVLSNLLVDLSYAYLDPRVRYT